MSRAIPRGHYIRIDIESLPSGSLVLSSQIIRRFPRKREEIVTSRPYVRLANVAGYVNVNELVSALEQHIRLAVQQEPLF